VTDVHYYKMSEVSDKMSYESVIMTAGPKIAEFCRDYTVKFEKTTAIAEGGEFAATIFKDMVWNSAVFIIIIGCKCSVLQISFHYS